MGAKCAICRWTLRIHQKEYLRILRVRRVSPLLFFDGIQLSAIPELGWTSNFFSSILACTHRVSPFHPRPARPQPCGIIALTRCGLVSVPEPELSPHIF